jgi:hypothetical protein
MPKTNPTPAAELKPKTTQNMDMRAGKDGHTAGIIQTISAPARIPITPPISRQHDRLEA